MDAYWNYKQRGRVGNFFLLYPAVNVDRVIWNKSGKQINKLLDYPYVYRYFKADKLLYTHCKPSCSSVPIAKAPT